MPTLTQQDVLDIHRRHARRLPSSPTRLRRCFPDRQSLLPAEDFMMTLEAQGTWTLERIGGGEAQESLPFAYPPLPPGIYALTFRQASVNLATLIIDPDPGTGESGE